MNIAILILLGRLLFGPGKCEVVFEDTLGDMPPSRGGPVARQEIGSGVMCRAYTW